MTTAYRTTFLERIERTPKAKSYRFARPEGLTFAAGQYMLLDLGDRLLHPLSLSNGPHETGFIEFTKRMTGSPFCERLESLARGEEVGVKGPAGRFVHAPSGRTLVMVAGGIGITPLRSILADLANGKERAGSIILLYGNVNRDDIPFREELENIVLPDYRLVHVLSDTAGMEKAVYKGFINAGVISREVPQCTHADYMISGPPGMVEAIKKELASLNVAENRIRTDIFLGYD